MRKTLIEIFDFDKHVEVRCADVAVLTHVLIRRQTETWDAWSSNRIACSMIGNAIHRGVKDGVIRLHHDMCTLDQALSACRELNWSGIEIVAQLPLLADAS